MPTYLSPGVYVQEVSSGSKPIEGVGTAVAAFVGLAEKGPANTPTLVTNWTQFSQVFGDFVEGSFLAHAVYGYFLNGGGSAYVVRVGSDGDSPAPSARAELAGKGEPGRPVYRITAAEGGPAGDDITVEIGDPGEPGEDAFKVTVSRAGKVEETFDNLTAKRGATNAVTVVKARSKLIHLEEVGTGGALSAPEMAPSSAFPRPAASASPAAGPASRSASPPTTTSATRRIAPVSRGSRPSTRSPCSASPT